MAYKSTFELVQDLERKGMLIRVKEEVDPDLEMAAIHRKVFSKDGPALLFEKVKGCRFMTVSNLYGTEERCKYIFRDTLGKVTELIRIKDDPIQILKNPLKNFRSAVHAVKALPKKRSQSSLSPFKKCQISDLPMIRSWPDDGGAFITLPLVYSEHPEKSGPMNSNLGMYRVQLNGNNYQQDREIGLHYQIHRGIGVHQTIAQRLDQPLKVSVFIGGPPALTWSAVMPLPEDMPEVCFAGILGNRRFNYIKHDGYTIAVDADFVICGEIIPGHNKPEGPFGDHLGYYSLKHNYPVLRVKHVFYKENSIWPFTVVGRPPQEDSLFGKLIHQITGSAIQSEIKGLKSVHAVDESGVHPLLLAVGTERYTPYQNSKKPSELLTIANHILGTGQLSLAKYLFILSDEDVPDLNINNVKHFIIEVLKRFDPLTDLHFQTNTSIDTLDYSGGEINSGSKLVIAARGEAKRVLSEKLDLLLPVTPTGFSAPIVLFKGVLAIECASFSNYANAEIEIKQLCDAYSKNADSLLEAFPLIVLTDDVKFLEETFENFIWCTFTRSNPAADIYGINAFSNQKHWSSAGSIIIDARRKPFHAPELREDPEILKRVDTFGLPGSSLHGYI